MPLMAAGVGIPKAAGWAMELATNPDAWKTGKVIGEVLGGTAGLIHSGPMGAAGGMYAGGKTGWRLVNAAQRAAAPLASALEKAAPYAQTLSTLAGAQGVGDLAQMADPKRTDIGVLGIGGSHDPIDPKDVPLVNEGIAKVFDKMGRSDLAKLWRGER